MMKTTVVYMLHYENLMQCYSCINYTSFFFLVLKSCPAGLILNTIVPVRSLCGVIDTFDA